MEFIGRKGLNAFVTYAWPQKRGRRDAVGCDSVRHSGRVPTDASPAAAAARRTRRPEAPALGSTKC